MQRIINLARRFRAPKPVSNFQPEPTRPIPSREDCYFYHSMAFPDGEHIQGTWTINDFREYIGHYPVAGKTMLDVGTASGYIAFNAEQHGAEVTAMDAEAAVSEFRCIPFANSKYVEDVQKWRSVFNAGNLIRLKNSWWYSWHKLSSKATVYYKPMGDLYLTDAPRFDIVMAGALIEHLSDPVTAIGAFARVAKEAVVIPFTDVLDTDELVAKPLSPWSDPNMSYAWWQLSRGLYRQLFDNMGFDVSFTQCSAFHHDAANGAQIGIRPTIIATRRV